jgi:hypothetical protein
LARWPPINVIDRMDAVRATAHPSKEATMHSPLQRGAGSARKLLLTLVVVGAAGSLAGFGAFSAFTAGTTNTGDSFAAGNVAIGDNDATTEKLYDETLAVPDTAAPAKCITVTYTGTADASAVKLYRSAFTGAQLGFEDAVQLKVTSGSFPGAAPASLACTGFTAAGSAGDVYSGALSGLGATYAGGVALTVGGSAIWTANDKVTYKFEASFPAGVDDAADNAYQDGTTGTHDFTWEAHS